MPPPARSRRRGTAFAIGVVVAALVGLGAPLSPAAVERWYSRGLYPPLQRTLTAISNLVPFALLDVAVLLALGLWAAMVLRIARSVRPGLALRMIAGRLVVFTAASYLIFLLL